MKHILTILIVIQCFCYGVILGILNIKINSIEFWILTTINILPLTFILLFIYLDYFSKKK